MILPDKITLLLLLSIEGSFVVGVAEDCVVVEGSGSVDGIVVVGRSVEIVVGGVGSVWMKRGATWLGERKGGGQR